MANTSNVRKFEYRPYRIAAGFAVEFIVGNQSVQGMCCDVSDTGIRAEFNAALPEGAQGLLILRHSTGTLEVEAQVGYQEKAQVSLTFLFKSSWERGLAMEYIAGIANHQDTAPFVRFV
jgi:hypothetical protein